jgi:hypothetical protein
MSRRVRVTRGRESFALPSRLNRRRDASCFSGNADLECRS